MARRKNNGGRTTPKGGPDQFRPMNDPSAFGTAKPTFPQSADGGGAAFQMDDLDDPGMELFSAMLEENGLSLADPDELGDGSGSPFDRAVGEAETSEDLLGILIDRLDDELAAGPGEFLQEVANFTWMIHSNEPEGERSMIIEPIASTGLGGLALATALLQIGLTEEVRSAAEARAPLGRSEVPAWLRSLNQAKVGRVSQAIVQFDDDFELLFEVLLADGDPIHVLVRIDRLKGETIVDASSGPETFDELMEPDATDAADFVTSEISHQLAADLLVHSFERSLELSEQEAKDVRDGLAEPDPTGHGAMGLPLVRWVMSLLPDSGVAPFRELADDQLNAVYEEFQAALGRKLDEAELDTLDAILLLTGEHNAYRWSPSRVMELIGNYALTFRHFDRVMPLLREFVPWAIERNEVGSGSADQMPVAERQAAILVVMDRIDEMMPEILAEMETLRNEKETR